MEPQWSQTTTQHHIRVQLQVLAKNRGVSQQCMLQLPDSSDIRLHNIKHGLFFFLFVLIFYSDIIKCMNNDVTDNDAVI